MNSKRLATKHIIIQLSKDNDKEKSFESSKKEANCYITRDPQSEYPQNFYQ